MNDRHVPTRTSIYYSNTMIYMYQHELVYMHKTPIQLMIDMYQHELVYMHKTPIQWMIDMYQHELVYITPIQW